MTNPLIVQRHLAEDAQVTHMCDGCNKPIHFGYFYIRVKGMIFRFHETCQARYFYSHAPDAD